MPQFTPPKSRIDPLQIMGLLERRRQGEQQTERQAAQDDEVSRTRVMNFVMQSGADPKKVGPLLGVTDLPFLDGLAELSKGKQAIAKQEAEAKEQQGLFKENLSALGSALGGLDTQQPDQRAQALELLQALNPQQRQAAGRRGAAERLTQGANQRQKIEDENRQRAGRLRERKSERDIVVRNPLQGPLEQVQAVLRRGTAIDGTPLSPKEIAQLEGKANRLAIGPSRVFKSDGAGGFLMAEGPATKDALSSARVSKFEDKLQGAMILRSDLDDLIGLIEERPQRAGIPGSALKLTETVAGTLRQLAALEGQPLRGYAQNTLDRIEADVDRGGAHGVWLENANNLFEDAAQGDLRALSFFVSYDIARQARGEGRLNVQDVKRSEDAFGITGAKSVSSVLGALKRARKKTDVNIETLKIRLKNAGTVSISVEELDEAIFGEKRREEAERSKPKETPEQLQKRIDDYLDTLPDLPR